MSLKIIAKNIIWQLCDERASGRFYPEISACGAGKTSA